MKPRKFIPGARFGRLVLLVRVGNLKSSNQRWLCLCDCGKTKVVQAGNMGGGVSTSCGCYHSEELSRRQESHGKCRTPEYRTWSNMKHRCSNQSCVMFHRYGGRGIQVCDRWAGSFENFYADMGPRPSAKHSIDRIDNNGHYEPGNCRWATKQQQMSNISLNTFVEVGGERLIQSEAARKLGLSVSGLRYRMQKAKREGTTL